jgi:hypothetical protein
VPAAPRAAPRAPGGGEARFVFLSYVSLSLISLLTNYIIPKLPSFVNKNIGTLQERISIIAKRTERTLKTGFFKMMATREFIVIDEMSKACK